MHQSVNDAFVGFTEPLEGRVEYMYLDILGLVTTGIGNLIDPVHLALQIPWKRRDGALASHQEISEDWHRLKARQDLKSRHHKFAAAVTSVRLDEADIRKLVAKKLAANERDLRRAFPEWDRFPADAQLGILSMAWAMGSGFPGKFQNFTRAVNRAQDWVVARACCKIRETGNPGVVPRNRANELCFANAATVVELGMDRTVLHWPGAVSLKSEPMIPTNPPQAPSAADVEAQVSAGIANEVRDNLTPSKPTRNS